MNSRSKNKSKQSVSPSPPAPLPEYWARGARSKDVGKDEADVIGQLGVPDRTNPEQCKSILRGMLTADENAEVLRAVLVAISHQNDIDAIPLVIGFSTHHDSDVRHGVVLALSIHNGHYSESSNGRRTGPAVSDSLPRTQSVSELMNAPLP